MFFNGCLHNFLEPGEALSGAANLLKEVQYSLKEVQSVRGTVRESYSLKEEQQCSTRSNVTNANYKPANSLRGQHPLPVSAGNHRSGVLIHGRMGRGLRPGLLNRQVMLRFIVV